MRWPFTDGFNSFSHVLFGIISYVVPILIPAFLAYQFILYPDKNSGIDVFEFAVGYFLVWYYNSPFFKQLLDI